MLCESLLSDCRHGFGVDQAALSVEHYNCPNCGAPAGSACRARSGKTVAKYHTPRFVLAPELREELEVPVPADRPRVKAGSRRSPRSRLPGQ